MTRLLDPIRCVIAEYSAEFGVPRDRMLGDTAFAILAFAVLFMDTVLIVAGVRS